MTEARILVGDCREVMAAMDAESVDAVVTDPPYDLTTGKRGGTGAASINLDSPYGRSRIGTGNGSGGFMGQTWDSTGVAFDPETWRSVYRVMKPGAHLIAFGGTRTHHRLWCAVEDAGFEIRDTLMWLFGSGFPKSKNLDGDREGWGTALKPGYEPIVLARKPLRGTVAANVARYWTGALNIDGCRIGASKDVPASPRRAAQGPAYGDLSNDPGTGGGWDPDLGRWPANVVLSHADDCRPAGTKRVKGTNPPGPAGFRNPSNTLSFKSNPPPGRGRRPGGFGGVGAEKGDPTPNGPTYGHETVEAWECEPDCPVRLLDEQSGERPAGSPVLGTEPSRPTANVYNGGLNRIASMAFGDTGGASRFYYCAKADRRERDFGLDRLAARAVAEWPQSLDGEDRRGASPRRNHHPCVKPLDLMRWLVRLVTPSTGLVLDPFAGSGTTGVACRIEGFGCVLIEREPEYIPIIEARVSGALGPLFAGDTASLAPSDRPSAPSQMTMEVAD